MEPALGGWDNFYVIVGSSSGALIGLQFVVITLLAETGAQRDHEAVSAFATPTVVHFAGSLLISAIMSAPGWSGSALALILAVCGLTGLAYGAAVAYRARHQSQYPPGWEDWLWYVVLPCCVYLVLLIGALTLRTSVPASADMAALAALALLFIGIHNAWDTVTYIVVSRPRDEE